MSSQDRATIIREVSIVFHVAATLRFDEKLKLAVPINVRSTRDVLNLCKEISNLKSFVHVSTAYANCPQKVIEEKFYDSPMDSDKLIALMECVEDKLAEDITPQYVDSSLFEFLALIKKRQHAKRKTYFSLFTDY
ncbi:hypothetical protein ACFW04_008770 [Cataglyphis niger]